MKNLIFYYLAVDNHTGEIIPGSLGASEAETKQYTDAYQQLEANDEHEIVTEYHGKYRYTIEPLTEAQYYSLVGKGML